MKYLHRSRPEHGRDIGGKGGSHMIFAAVGGGMIITCGAFVWYILKH